MGGELLNISYVSCVEESKGLNTLLEIARILQAEHVDKYVKIDFYGQKKDHFFDEHLADIAMFEYKRTAPTRGGYSYASRV